MGLFASALGHVGDGMFRLMLIGIPPPLTLLGNFHTCIIYNGDDPAERKKVETCVHNMVDRALEMEGTCTVSASSFMVDTVADLLTQGEHGIGLGKKESLMKELGPETLETMRLIKRALDPHLLMNPGKIMDFDELEKIRWK